MCHSLVRSENNEHMEKLIEVAKKVINKNPHALLSGSLALHLQKVDTRRLPTDVDIFLPFNQPLVLVEGMKELKSDDKEHYESYFDVTSYKLDGIKVDVFTPLEEGFTIPEYLSLWRSEVPCVEMSEIIRFKIEHSFGEHFTRYKHKDDIIYLLVKNVQ